MDWPCCSWNIAHLRILKPDPPRVFLTMPKTLQIILNFLEPISAFYKSSWFINSYLRKSCFKNPENWLAESVLANSRTRIFLDMGFVQAERYSFAIFLNTKLITKFWKVLQKHYFWPFWTQFTLTNGYQGTLRTDRQTTVTW